jgi:hypothetical protein
MVHLFPMFRLLLVTLILGFSSSLDAAQSQTALDDGFDPKALEAIAIKHGFKDLDEWSTVASSVAMSNAYAIQGKKNPERSKMPSS